MKHYKTEIQNLKNREKQILNENHKLKIQLNEYDKLRVYFEHSIKKIFNENLKNFELVLSRRFNSLLFKIQEIQKLNSKIKLLQNSLNHLEMGKNQKEQSVANDHQLQIQLLTKHLQQTTELQQQIQLLTKQLQQMTELQHALFVRNQQLQNTKNLYLNQKLKLDQFKSHITFLYNENRKLKSKLKQLPPFADKRIKQLLSNRDYVNGNITGVNTVDKYIISFLKIVYEQIHQRFSKTKLFSKLDNSTNYTAKVICYSYCFIKASKDIVYNGIQSQFYLLKEKCNYSKE